MTNHVFVGSKLLPKFGQLTNDSFQSQVTSLRFIVQNVVYVYIGFTVIFFLFDCLHTLRAFKILPMVPTVFTNGAIGKDLLMVPTVFINGTNATIDKTVGTIGRTLNARGTSGTIGKDRWYLWENIERTHCLAHQIRTTHIAEKPFFTAICEDKYIGWVSDTSQDGCILGVCTRQDLWFLHALVVQNCLPRLSFLTSSISYVLKYSPILLRDNVVIYADNATR